MSSFTRKHPPSFLKRSITTKSDGLKYRIGFATKSDGSSPTSEAVMISVGHISLKREWNEYQAFPTE